MSQIVGHLCDVCERFSVTRDGWLKVSSYADKNNAGIDVCGNDCLISLGKQRKQSGLGDLIPDVTSAPAKKKRRSGYSEDVILEVLAYAQKHSVTHAQERFGIPYSTIYNWSNKYGINVKQTQEGKEGTS